MNADEWTLVDYLDNVKDRETFVDFLWALTHDREETVEREDADPEGRGYGAYGWQNSTLEAYFACLASSMGNYDELLPEPSWATFANFLYCGKIYE